MPYGFLVRNGDKVIMDDNFSNLMSSSKGNLSLSLHSSDSTVKSVTNFDGDDTSAVYFDEYRAKIPMNAQGEMLFFEVPNGRRVYVGFWGDGELMVYSNSPQVRWVRAKYMRYLPAPSSGSYGLFVRDAQGRYTYSSEFPYLQVTGSLINPPSQGIWVAPSTHGFHGTGGGNGGIYYDQGVRNDNGTLIPQGLRGNTNRDFSYTGSRPSRIRGMVADITWSNI